jgi:hypothetical protein
MADHKGEGCRSWEGGGEAREDPAHLGVLLDKV